VVTIGSRTLEGDAWADQGRLVRTAALLRGGSGLVPRGVYRPSSFEEADAWLTKMMVAAQERRSPTTSSASAGR
jgi:hypothetical protein